MDVPLDAYLKETVAELEKLGVPEARLNMEHLLARRSGVSRLELLAQHRGTISSAILEGAAADVTRLAAGEPLQYILGDTPFHGLVLKTDRRALIPRPETEELVEQVLACRAIWESPAPVVADVGTGSGCIALALASLRPTARILAMEADPGARSLASENVVRLGFEDRVTVEARDLLDGVPPGSLDAVVSNPPYIPSKVCATLERHVRDHEPRMALDGGPDGLEVIRRLAGQSSACLKPDRPLWLEIGHDQGDGVRSILIGFGFKNVEIRRDHAGLDRLALGWRGA